MAFILETEISENKTLRFALQEVFGLGKKTSKTICYKLGFSENFKVRDMSKEQVLSLIKLIETSTLLINNDLRKKTSTLLKTLITIKAYRGLRRLNNLPVRGQRTHTNAKTAKRFKKNKSNFVNINRKRLYWFDPKIT